MITAFVLLAACGRGFEYEGGDPDNVDTGPLTVSNCGDDLDLEAGINIAGVAVDAQTGAPLDKLKTPLCMTAIDPTGAVTGGEPEPMAASQMCEDGSFIIPGIEEIPTIGVMVQVDDCGKDDTVMTTVTGVRAGDFAGMEAGDTLEDLTAYSVSAGYRDELETELSAFGYKGELAKDGFLGGFVRDSAGEPVGGAEVTCGSCGDRPTYYADAEPKDGLFGNGGANTSTVADAGSFFIIPKARITTYTCEDGGDHTWEARLYGSLPGYGVFINFLAD